MPDPSSRDHLRSAFAFRAGYLAIAWLLCLAFAEPNPSGVFPTLVSLLARALPIAAPLILWFDWRWLRRHADEVNRYGIRRRR